MGKLGLVLLEKYMFVSHTKHTQRKITDLFHSFLPKFWVVENFFGFFKIDEIFAKFLDRVLLK